MPASATFDYEAYFRHYQTGNDTTRENVWRIYYRELLWMHSPEVVHITDGNLLDRSPVWQERVERFHRFLRSNLPVPPGDPIQDHIGHLYKAHATHTGETLQQHNIEGAGFAYLTRALLIRFCDLSPEHVRIGPLWTTLPGYDHLSGVPHVPRIRPDVAVIGQKNGHEDTYGVIMLKWTIRHDRLKNAMTEADSLRNRKRGGRSTFITFLTNEFNTGRLKVAADSPELNCVYHVSLSALYSIYEGEETPTEQIKHLADDGVLKDVSDLFTNFR